MAHLKRQKVPKSWPIERKGTAYVVRPLSNISKGLPVLIILRDILKLAQTRKEVKKVLHDKKILLNGKPVQEEKNPALLFDVITVVPMKKNYMIELAENGKFQVSETKNADRKIAKIINKKTLKGKKVQINLSDGNNVLSDVNCRVNDSVILNLKEKKIESFLPLKEKVKVLVVEGKHAGRTGTIKKLIAENKTAEIDIKGNKVNILIKQIMVVE